MAAAAQPLIALLEPLAADQIQAEVAMLSRDILLVVQSVSTEKACRQVGNPHVQPTGFFACWLEVTQMNVTQMLHYIYIMLR